MAYKDKTFALFCRHIINLWALQENNALELANQSEYYICYKHRSYKICNNPTKPTVANKEIVWFPAHEKKNVFSRVNITPSSLEETQKKTSLELL